MPNKTYLYYRLKPFIPFRVRIALRRWRAMRLRGQYRNSWPILEKAGQSPKGWRGWPGGKRFAFVLTHDVESRKGLDRCRQLSELDSRFGFRSAFNFVPEGDYEVSAGLRAHLEASGFEVGVHDLKHDGFLYDSRQRFKTNARMINEYLGKWNAAGFRSAFMHHRLDWYHDLEIQYDASTFDTDPFEPRLAYKLFQFPELRLSLTGVSHDKSGSDSHAGNPLPDVRRKIAPVSCSATPGGVVRIE